MLVPPALLSPLFRPTPEAPHGNAALRPVCDLAHAPAPRGSFFSSHVPFSCFAAVSFSSRRGAALMPHSRFIHPMTRCGIPRPITPPTRQESNKSSLTFSRPFLMLFRRQARFRPLRLSDLVPITEPALLADVIDEERDTYHGKHQRGNCQRKPHLFTPPSLVPRCHREQTNTQATVQGTIRLVLLRFPAA